MGISHKQHAHVFKARARLSVLRQMRLHLGNDPVPVQVRGGQNNVGLFFKIAEKGALRKPGPAGNLAHAGFLDALLQKALQGLFYHELNILLAQLLL